METKESNRPKVGLFFICTSKYNLFWKFFKAAADKFFLPDADKTYFLFTDSDRHVTGDDTTVIPVEHRPWPYMTLYRASILLSAYDKWKDMDYVVFCNSNMIFCNPMNMAETFGNKPLMACCHPLANGGMSTYSLEHNPKSCAYMDKPTVYVCGGFQGGRTEAFASALREMKAWVDKDAENGITAVWHDESHWNKYCFLHQPDVHLLGWPTLYVSEHPWVKAWLIDKKEFWRGAGIRNLDK